MQQDRPLFRTKVLVLYAISFSILVGSAIAKKPGKTYPDEGKVVGTGVAERGQQVHSHTYKIETATRILVLDCGTRFGFSGGECGGNRKIQIGDTLHFRAEKSWVYIPASDAGGQISEQKLRIVSEQLKPDTSADRPEAPKS